MYSLHEVFLKEKRSHPLENKKEEDFLIDLAQYKDDPNYFIHFSDIKKVGINPSVQWSIRGIYAYPLKEIWEKELGHDIIPYDLFATDRKYVFLLYANRNALLNSDSYSNKKFVQDLKKLKAWCIENLIDEKATVFLYTLHDFCEIIDETETKKSSSYNDKSDSEYIDIFFDIILNYGSHTKIPFLKMLEFLKQVSYASYSFGKSEPFMFYILLYKVLGYIGLVASDRKLHGDLFAETIFFNPKDFKIVKMYDNSIGYEHQIKKSFRDSRNDIQ